MLHHRPDIRPAEPDLNLAGGFLDGTNQVRETVAEFIEEIHVQSPLTSRAAPLISSTSGPGSQKPVTIRPTVRIKTAVSRHGYQGVRGSTAGPSTSALTCSSRPANTPVPNRMKSTPVTVYPARKA